MYYTKQAICRTGDIVIGHHGYDFDPDYAYIVLAQVEPFDFFAVGYGAMVEGETIVSSPKHWTKIGDDNPFPYIPHVKTPTHFDIKPVTFSGRYWLELVDPDADDEDDDILDIIYIAPGVSSLAAAKIAAAYSDGTKSRTWRVFGHE